MRCSAVFVLCASMLVTTADAADEPAASQKPAASTKPTASPEQIAEFETHVRPLLVEHCQSCHNADDQQGGIRLDGRSHLLSDANGYAAVVPHDLASSRLVDVIAYSDDDIQMPPDGKLPDEAIATLRQWIEAGAYYPDDADAAETDSAWPLKEDGSIDFAAVGERHWAYHPVGDPQPPLAELSDAGAAAVRTPIDAFVVRRLEAEGLTLSEEAEPRTLLRRLASDTTGLPPTYEQSTAYGQQVAAGTDAYEQAVDRYLADPHFGERWGRHWLDVARYADTKGYVAGERSIEYPYAYSYRDWVVGAINDDLPYDRFVTHQLAADLVAPDDPQAQAALGLLNVGPKFVFNIVEINNDRIDVITSGFLATTVACARCHDHKFDPVPQADYWSMYAMLKSTDEPKELPLIVPETEQPQTDSERDFRTRKAALTREADAVHDRHHRELMTDTTARMEQYLAAAAGDAGWMPRPEPLDPPLARRPVRLWQRWMEQAHHSPVATAIFEAASIREEADYPTRLLGHLRQKAAEGEAATPKRLIDGYVLDRLTAESVPDFETLVRRIGQWYTQLHAKRAADAASLSPGEVAFLNTFLIGRTPLTMERGAYFEYFTQAGRREVAAAEGKVAELVATHPAAPARAMVVREDKPVYSPVYIRGDVNRPGPFTPRRSPQLIDPSGAKYDETRSGRDELAADIVDPNNPLTARVAVNRIWQHYFGTGLVATASDFGSRSEPPSHPELLDYLARRLIDSGWSTKAIHREILLSAVYRQSSATTPDAAQRDPINRLLSHQTRRRLDFEPMRDAILQAGGLLDEAIGGRAFIEGQPDDGPPRRTLYAKVNRNDLDDSWLAFDFPSPDQTTGGRTSTTVPQQALFHLNAPLTLRAAEAVATQTSDLRDLFRQVLGRDPTPREHDQCRAFFEAGGNRRQLAQALMLSNEFHYID